MKIVIQPLSIFARKSSPRHGSQRDDTHGICRLSVIELHGIATACSHMVLTLVDVVEVWNYTFIVLRHLNLRWQPNFLRGQKPIPIFKQQIGCVHYSIKSSFSSVLIRFKATCAASA